GWGGPRTTPVGRSSPVTRRHRPPTRTPGRAPVRAACRWDAPAPAAGSGRLVGLAGPAAGEGSGRAEVGTGGVRRPGLAGRPRPTGWGRGLRRGRSSTWAHSWGAVPLLPLRSRLFRRRPEKRSVTPRALDKGDAFPFVA